MKLSILATFLLTLCLAATWAEAQSHDLQGATTAIDSVERHLRRKPNKKDKKKPKEVDEMPPLLDESLLTECPVIGPAVSCMIYMDPVMCGTTLQCYYDNPCTAWGAGWNAALQCNRTDPVTVHTCLCALDHPDCVCP
jgi:hypothetical protein